MAEAQRVIRNCPVAVVGGAGFLGSHLVEHLIEDRRCDVIVLDNLISGHKKFVHHKAKFIWCDITQSEERIRKIFEAYKIQFVFNYAAEPYIPISFERPLHVFDTNARAALMVLNAAQEAGVRAILQVSSAEIYGLGKSIGTVGINEDDPVEPHSSYGASKAAADFLVQVRWQEAKTPAIALRQFNCIGARETHPYIVPEIIDQISKYGRKQCVVNLGNDSFRDFLWAGDAVRAAAELLEKGKFGEVYNSGSAKGIHMYDLAKTIGQIMNVDVVVEEDLDRIRPWEIWHLQSDNTKLYETIEYRPATSLVTALAYAVEYYTRNGNKWDFE